MKRKKRAERLELFSQGFAALALAFLALAGVTVFVDITTWVIVGEEGGLIFYGGQIFLFVGLAASAGLVSLLFYRRSRRPARGIYYREEVADASGGTHPSLVRRRAVI